MTVLSVLIVIVVAGILLWIINNYLPMDRKIKNILNVVVVLLLLVWLLRVFGILDILSNTKI